MGEGEPHGAPLFDPRRRVWIEPHTALFHKDARVRGNSLFSPANVARRSIASTFDGRPVLRLADELQLVYIASYWLRDLVRDTIHPTLLIPLLDAVYLLKASAQSLDWDGLLDSLDNEMAIASLYLLLAQIRKYGFDEKIAPILPRLAARQRIVGAAELRIMDFLLDSCLVDGRKFMSSFGDRHPMIESSVVDTLLRVRSIRPQAHVTALEPRLPAACSRIATASDITPGGSPDFFVASADAVAHLPNGLVTKSITAPPGPRRAMRWVCPVV